MKTKKEFLPSSVDLSDGLPSTFGCCEFEKAACLIVKYLASEDVWQIADTLWGGNYEREGDSWYKPLTIGTVPGIEPTMFAMLASDGWLIHKWFPKGVFTVSEAFIKRLKNRQSRADKCVPRLCLGTSQKNLRSRNAELENEKDHS